LESTPDEYVAKLVEVFRADPVPDVVLDPFTGSGTTGAVAVKWGRRFVGCELNPEYIALAEKRIGAEVDAGGLFH
jgi:predicted RNA methylase